MRGNVARAFPQITTSELNAYEEEAKGSAIRHISITSFGRFPVPLPPLDEQREIVRRVDSLFALADTIERRASAALARVETLPQSILTKAFSGQLVPTEAELARAEGREYEPASALLERIRAERASPAARAARDNGTSTRAKRGPRRKRRT